MFKGKEILSHDDFADDVVGFIYRITYTNKQHYIGKKLIKSVVKLKPTKKQLATRKNYSRREMRNKPFVQYIGSHKTDKNMQIKSREIIEVCSDKINLTYCEIKWMMKYHVLNRKNYINENIAGKFFQGRIKRGL